MINFSSTEWQALLEQNGLGSFEALWNLKADWFEEPNHQRGGWSGVSRIELKRPDGSICGAFLKRQQNHTRRTLRHAIKGELTLLAEVVSKLHLSRLVHNCLYPKHIFIRQQEGQIDARAIDVEKAKFRRSAQRRTLRDLDSLNRRAKGISQSDRLTFLLAYLQQTEFDAQGKKLWRKLAKRANKSESPYSQ